MTTDHYVGVGAACLQAARIGSLPDVVYCRVRWAGHAVSGTAAELCKAHDIPLFRFTQAVFLQLKWVEAAGRGLADPWQEAEDEETDEEGEE